MAGVAEPPVMTGEKKVVPLGAWQAHSTGESTARAYSRILKYLKIG